MGQDGAPLGKTEPSWNADSTPPIQPFRFWYSHLGPHSSLRLCTLSVSLSSRQSLGKIIFSCHRWKPCSSLHIFQCMPWVISIDHILGFWISKPSFGCQILSWRPSMNSLAYLKRTKWWQSWKQKNSYFKNILLRSVFPPSLPPALETSTYSYNHNASEKGPRALWQAQMTWGYRWRREHCQINLGGWEIGHTGLRKGPSRQGERKHPFPATIALQGQCLGTS